MDNTRYYKRLVLDLCEAYRNGDAAAISTFGTAHAHLEILGLVAEGNTVALRVRLSGAEQVRFFEGRDGVLASRHCVCANPTLPG